MYIITTIEQVGSDKMWQASISNKAKANWPSSDNHWDCATVIGTSLHECVERALAACKGLDAGV